MRAPQIAMDAAATPCAGMTSITSHSKEWQKL